MTKTIPYLVDEILHADDAELAERLLNQVVGSDRSTVTLDLDRTL